MVWGDWGDFPCTVPPPPVALVLAFKSIRLAEVWVPVSWNEGSGGGRAASLAVHVAPLGVPPLCTVTRALTSFLISSRLKLFPMGRVGGLVEAFRRCSWVPGQLSHPGW